MAPHRFRPFHTVGIGGYRQRQPPNLHMHQSVFGDLKGIVGLVSFAQDSLGASGSEEGQPFNHSALEFHIRRDRAPIGNAGRYGCLD